MWLKKKYIYKNILGLINSIQFYLYSFIGYNKLKYQTECFGFFIPTLLNKILLIGTTTQSHLTILGCITKH